ncbi:MAG: phosphotransferase [Gammaproteobacteria bacterium]|jgi:ubiquinone biosynthesis protein|nr:phosphotransferase [Gammaproteobacteria bacterium]MBQ0773911.1 phosphotransferase [Gammaproteobacteria bacterium]|tara:strand:+ start:39771 stop:41435 length:1665 start_codon:yes stop_codon:yes gene_type:complete
MNLLTTGKDLRRVNELATILLKYGFGDVIRRLDLVAPLEQAGKLVRQSVSREFLTMPPGARMRRALEEMGPTFVKLGQILATRVDLFPPDWVNEFEQLQDNAQEIPFAHLEPLIVASLGKPINQVFASVDPVPIGVASIGQVHRAVTRKGEQVVLKIQKPDIQAKIEADLRLLDMLAKLAADNSIELRRYRPVDLVREFERSLMRELDFTIEARSSDRIRKNMRSIPWLTIPKVYWEVTSARLSVQQFIDGIPARQLERIEDAGLDRKLLARRGALVAWKMTLEDGFFHADPHPGNFLILPNNNIAMLDFGMVGKLSSARQEQMVQIMKSVVMQEPTTCAAVLASWSDGQPVKMDQLTTDIEDVISAYYGVPLADLDITALLSDITALLRNFDLILPSDIALMLKAIITLEGFGRMMNPQFDLMSEAEPLLKRMMRKRYSPTRLAKSISLRALDAVDRLYAPPPPSGAAPQDAQPGLDPRHLERMVARLERSQFRLVQTLLTISGVLTGAIMMAGRVAPTLWDISVFGLLFLLGSGVWSVWLMLVARRHLREWE